MPLVDAHAAFHTSEDYQQAFMHWAKNTFTGLDDLGPDGTDADTEFRNTELYAKAFTDWMNKLPPQYPSSNNWEQPAPVDHFTSATTRVDAREMRRVGVEALWELDRIQGILEGFVASLEDGEYTTVPSGLLSVWWNYRDQLGEIRKRMTLDGNSGYSEWSKL